MKSKIPLEIVYGQDKNGKIIEVIMSLDDFEEIIHQGLSQESEIFEALAVNLSKVKNNINDEHNIIQ